MEINFDDFITLQPPDKAILRGDYELDFETEEGIKVHINLGCGEAVSYCQNKDGSFTVYQDSVSLDFPEEVFPHLFHPVDYRKLPKGQRYCSFGDISTEVVEGWTSWIHDFEQDLIIHAIVQVEDDEYVMEMIVASAQDENGEIAKAIACRKDPYLFSEYGDTWAAIRDQREDEE